MSDKITHLNAIAESAAKASAEMTRPTPGSGRPASMALAKRFYTKATVGAEGNGFTVLLDGKPLRTPARNALLLPTKQLADAVAAEWDAQTEIIDKAQMPLMALCCIALDVATTKADEMRFELLQYGTTDQLCYREPEGEIRAAQELAYDALLAWAKLRYGASLDVTHGIYPIEQPETAMDALDGAIAKLDKWQLAAASVSCGITRSLVMSLAMIEGQLDAKESHRIAALEEQMQADAWGMDDDQQARIDVWARDLAAIELLLTSLR